VWLLLSGRISVREEGGLRLSIHCLLLSWQDIDSRRRGSLARNSVSFPAQHRTETEGAFDWCVILLFRYNVDLKGKEALTNNRLKIGGYIE
jgi:hypothetical protein